MAQQLSGNDLQGWDGWIWIGAGSRVSGTSLTITGDYTAIISPGDRLKLTDTTTKYFYVLTPVTFSAGVTTLTVTGGSDYSLVGTPSAISYSKMATPASFPQWFNYTPTYTGFSTAPSGGIQRFQVIGRQVTFVSAPGTVGTSNTTSFTVSLPITASSVTNGTWNGQFRVTNNGVVSATPGMWFINGTLTSAQIYADNAANGWTASGSKNGTGVIIYEF